MNINTENYEEYFLMYADNELTPEQKKIVETYVKTNPQLKREWDEIMATVQVPDDDITFPKKSSLVKTSLDNFIDEHNYSERFTEYHDNELPESEKVFVETFLKTHPELKNEFDSLGIARFKPDNSIQYPDKESLYRHATKIRPFILWRIAAAAVITGLLVWSGYRIISPSEQFHQTPQALVNHQSETGKENNSPKETVQTERKTSVQESVPKTVLRSTTVLKNQENILPVIKEGRAKNKAEQEIVSATETNPENISPVVAPGFAKGIAKNNFVNPKIISSAKITAESISNEVLDKTIPSQAINLTALQDDSQDNHYVLTDIPSERIKQSKLGIFIKKARRTIDRSNPINRLFNEDDN